MKKKLFSLFGNPLVITAVLSAFIARIASAAPEGMPPAPTLVSTTANLDMNLFCPIIDIMFWVLISVSIIMVLWAAWLYVIAEGDAEKPSQARKMVLYAAIGIVIALLAKGVPNIVGSLFDTGTSFSLAC
jgi:RsiW-degrading membrane proteinase PrsW (M82 family)